MNYIKTNSLQEAEDLQSLINSELTNQIQGYSASRWCNPIKHQTEEQYLVDVGEGQRNTIILSIIPENSEIVEINSDDENWFPKMDINMIPKI